MYSKDIEPTKLNLIKKQIADYYKYKSDESNVITQKIMKYDELYKNPRERNNYEYELFLAKKEELYNIYKETRTLAALYDYLNYKYDTSIVPDIYTYAHINLNEREKVVKDAKAPNAPKAPKAANAKVCPEGKILNPKTNRCVKDPSYKKPKEANVSPKADANDASASAPAIPAIPAKEAKVCPEGKILNPKTNRCIKDPSYKKPKDAKP